MTEQLKLMEERFDQLNRLLQEPEIISDKTKYTSYMKEYASLEEPVQKYRQFKKVLDQIRDNKEILNTENDKELCAMAKEELAVLEPQKISMEEDLKLVLLPKDPNDEKNIILEIRPAAGGDESALFTQELFRAYEHYASRQGWKVEILSLSDGNVGGFREVIASISGEKVFSKLKYESGVHRVQRVPKTETQGRVHTSTVTVAVLPEVQEVDVQLDPNDLKIDVYRSGGKGGQSVNTTDSAVRVTHLPTNTVVVCQDEKSQLKNKNKAMKILLARLQAAQIQSAQKDASDARLAQIGTGDRSERIRTYNFPQTRVTDHRIGVTLHQLSSVMEGDLELLIDPLIHYYQAEALKAQKSN